MATKKKEVKEFTADTAEDVWEAAADIRENTSSDASASSYAVGVPGDGYNGHVVIQARGSLR